MPRYIDPFIDFGFKYIFGREESKPLLMDFLNELLREEPGFVPIVKIDFLDKEKIRSGRKTRGVIYDIHCECSNGRRFTVEMQNQPQPYFFDRIIYYAAKGIVDQGMAGKDWKYSYLPVYCISFMKFVMEGYENRFRIEAALCDLETREPFSDKLRFIFLQTPVFGKTYPEECNTAFERWMYNIINLSEMDTVAFMDQNSVFKSLDSMASYAMLSEQDRRAYDADVKAYRDLRGQIEYAETKGKEKGRVEGRAEGRAEEKAEIIKELWQQGMGLDFIAGVAKITVNKVKEILNID
ncbi:MAG: Rpn family recombination-promoting nuclease/putative transposase [Muribaculaceae bacterium]|nr:Rpn family recombination-promoting nuclease/putative transposase [Muribaculaceae bacterium]